METDELAAALRLDASGLPWCVMAGAAATCYGVTRPITDIDIFLQSADTRRILALFPEGQPKTERPSPEEYGLDLGPLELWWGTLALKGGERLYSGSRHFFPAKSPLSLAIRLLQAATPLLEASLSPFLDGKYSETRSRTSQAGMLHKRHQPCT